MKHPSGCWLNCAAWAETFIVIVSRGCEGDSGIWSCCGLCIHWLDPISKVGWP